jgi:hypothetical protein
MEQMNFQNDNVPQDFDVHELKKQLIKIFLHIFDLKKKIKKLN